MLKLRFLESLPLPVGVETIIDMPASMCYAETKKYNGRSHVRNCPFWRFS